MTDTSAAGTGAEPLRVARLRPGALVAGLVAVLGAMVIGMALGPVDISPKLIVYELLDDLPLINLDSGLSAQRVAIIEQIRLPRVVLGFLVGATLSVSGAAYQGAFRNPLADPYLLGIAAGAGLGATVAITQDWGDGGGFTDPVTDTFALSRTESLDSGNCTATWSFTGSYTGTDSLAGDFGVTFVGSYGDCADQTWALTGTR